MGDYNYLKHAGYETVYTDGEITFYCNGAWIIVCHASCGAPGILLTKTCPECGAVIGRYKKGMMVEYKVPGGFGIGQNKGDITLNDWVAEWLGVDPSSVDVKVG